MATDYLPPVLFLVALLLAWEVFVRVRGIAPWILPPPSDIWSAFLEVRGTLPGHLKTTMTEALIGLVLAAVFGIAIAALIASVGFARRALYPLLVISQNVPLIVLAPLLVIWFGFGVQPKIFVVALVGFFPIVVSTTDGLLRADAEMLELVRSMGANRWQALRTVRVPSALPSFFAGLKISATYAVLAAVIGEWVGASSGLGLFLTRSQTAFRTDRVFVGVVVIAALSIAMFLAVQLLSRLTTPWDYATNRRESS